MQTDVNINKRAGLARAGPVLRVAGSGMGPLFYIVPKVH